MTANGYPVRRMTDTGCRETLRGSPTAIPGDCTVIPEWEIPAGFRALPWAEARKGMQVWLVGLRDDWEGPAGGPGRGNKIPWAYGPHVVDDPGRKSLLSGSRDCPGKSFGEPLEMLVVPIPVPGFTDMPWSALRAGDSVYFHSGTPGKDRPEDLLGPLTVRDPLCRKYTSARIPGHAEFADRDCRPPLVKGSPCRGVSRITGIAHGVNPAGDPVSRLELEPLPTPAGQGTVLTALDIPESDLRRMDIRAGDALEIRWNSQGCPIIEGIDLSRRPPVRRYS